MHTRCCCRKTLQPMSRGLSLVALVRNQHSAVGMATTGVNFLPVFQCPCRLLWRTACSIAWHSLRAPAGRKCCPFSSRSNSCPAHTTRTWHAHAHTHAHTQGRRSLNIHTTQPHRYAHADSLVPQKHSTYRAIKNRRYYILVQYSCHAFFGAMQGRAATHEPVLSEGGALAITEGAATEGLHPRPAARVGRGWHRHSLHSAHHHTAQHTVHVYQHTSASTCRG